jgi:hypothetical protein
MYIYTHKSVLSLYYIYILLLLTMQVTELDSENTKIKKDMVCLWKFMELGDGGERVVNS